MKRSARLPPAVEPPYVSRPAPPRHERAWTIAGIAGFVLFLACYLSVRADAGLVALDRPVIDLFVGSPAPLVSFAMTMSLVGGSVVTVLAIALVGATLVALRRPWGGLRVLIIPAIAEIAVRALKQIIARPRPDEALYLAYDFSFPSGHATNAAVLACLLIWFALRHAQGRAAAIALLGFAATWLLVMALDRLILNVHHLTDVLGGIGLGVAIASAGLVLSSRAQGRWPHAFRRLTHRP